MTAPATRSSSTAFSTARRSAKTPRTRRTPRASTASRTAAASSSEPLVTPRAALLGGGERLDVLLLLEEHAQERELFDEALAADAGALEDRDPIDELARRRALADSR